MNEDLMLEKQLNNLRSQHREFEAMLATNGIDEFTKQRIKKQKLGLRDKMMQIENVLYPDVIA